MDQDVRALRTFEELMASSRVNVAQVTDDDALADALKGTVDLDKKKLLMRYKRLK